MDNWFTVERIDGDTFSVSEYKHWEETHCYLLRGTEKALLIDTGLGVSNLKPVIDGLTELPVTVVTTHVHWDHIGGHRSFPNFWVHEAEKEWIFRPFSASFTGSQTQFDPAPLRLPAGVLNRRLSSFSGRAPGCFQRGVRV